MTMANVDYWRTFRDFTTNAAIIADQPQDVVTFKGGDNIRLSFNEGDDIITFHADIPGIVADVTANLSVNNEAPADPSMLDYEPTTGTFTYYPPDLSDYATLSYVDSAVASGVANVDLTGYATEIWVQGYVGTAVNVPDLDDYVTKEEYNEDYIAINGKLDQIAANAVGYTGSAGQDGSSVKIVGSVPEYATLTTLPRWTNYLGQKGDGVILEDTGNLAVATVITPFPTIWEDVGPIIGYTGSRGAQGFDGSKGAPGFTGSAIVVGHTVFEQNVASNFWAINHNLGVQYLSVELVDASSNSIVGTYGYPTVKFVDDDNLTISWTEPATGYAVLSAGGGEQGNVGFSGSQGFSGSRGFTGSIGFTGSSGAFAALGFTGSTGAQGIQGFTGSQGNIGFTGSLSTTPGPIGFTGSKGNVGFNGSIGAQGNIGYTGSQGDIGYTGSQGDIGYTGSVSTTPGPAGFTGSRGYNGSIGAQGGTGFTGSASTAQGPIGFTGSKGDTGFNGSQGDTGFNGSQGDQGDTGFTGSKGDTGFNGSQGDTGFTGSASTVQGPAGFTGSQGDTGFTGSTGFDGSTGFTGSKGDTGAAGTSVNIVGSVPTSGDLDPAYTGSVGDGFIALDTGNLWVWDGANWNDAGQIRGYTGSQGDTGFTGSIGFTGSASTVQGPIGFTGSKGDTGFTGSQGDQGIVGFTGSKGDQGDVGFTGSQGDQGTVGFTGSQGDQGIVGFTGSQGDQGIIGFTGSQGDQGVIGFTGSKGDQGDVGFTGSKGDTGDTGFTGSASSVAGPTGFTGSQGDQGTVGFTGSQGDQGVVGFTGSKGDQGDTGFTGSSGAEDATLATVTSNGNTTSNDISVGAVDMSGEVIYSTDIATPGTAIDLNLTVHSLADGNYTLADGTDGQMLILTPRSGATRNGVNVTFSKIRSFNNTTDPAAVFNNQTLAIFASPNVTIGSCWIYVFADDAWNYMNLYQP